MCFSATASFSASIVMSVIGIVTFKSCKGPAERYLGAVPFLFALQQLSEGFVWLSINNSDYFAYQRLFTLSFLFFAWVVWPILIPVAFYHLEPIPNRKLWCKRLIYVGIAAGAYAIFAMIFKNPRPSIATFHIIYLIDKKYLHEVFFIPYQATYILSTVAPMFFSSLKGVKLLAFANFIALIFCFYLFQFALPSTWCFFAAFLSSIIYYILWQRNRLNLQNINSVS